MVHFQSGTSSDLNIIQVYGTNLKKKLSYYETKNELKKIQRTKFKNYQI